MARSDRRVAAPLAGERVSNPQSGMPARNAQCLRCRCAGSSIPCPLSGWAVGAVYSASEKVISGGGSRSILVK
jgi:hypothetical protein